MRPVDCERLRRQPGGATTPPEVPSTRPLAPPTPPPPPPPFLSPPPLVQPVGSLSLSLDESPIARAALPGARITTSPAWPATPTASPWRPAPIPLRTCASTRVGEALLRIVGAAENAGRARRGSGATSRASPPDPSADASEALDESRCTRTANAAAVAASGEAVATAALASVRLGTALPWDEPLAAGPLPLRRQRYTVQLTAKAASAHTSTPPAAATRTSHEGGALAAEGLAEGCSGSLTPAA